MTEEENNNKQTRDFKKVVDLEASRKERDDVRVKLRTEHKQAIMSRRRNQNQGSAQPPQYNVTVPPGEREMLENQNRVMTEVESACKTFKDVVKLVSLADAPVDPEKDPYAVILHTARSINVLLSNNAKVNETVYEWALEALVGSNILAELIICMSDARLVRVQDMFDLPMEAGELVVSITSLMQTPKTCDLVLSQTSLIPLLIDWCTRNEYLPMRYQAIDSLGNMLTGSVLARDSVLNGGFLPMLNAQFDLPDDRSSNELWEACSYALAMVFHVVPLPELSVVNLCIPALFKLMFVDDISAVVTAGLAGLAFIVKKNDKNYTALIANHPDCDEKVIAKLIGFMVPKDYRNSDDLKNRQYSMATVVGLARDVPGSWAPLWKLGALDKFTTLLGQYDQVSIIRALIALEFACADGSVQESYNAGIYNTVCTGILQEMMVHRQVKVGVASLLCTVVVTQSNPLNFQQLLKLTTEQGLFAHLVEGLRIGKLDVTLAERSLEAIDRLLRLGQCNMDSGVDLIRPWAEKTDLVNILKEIETETENPQVANMTTAMLEHYFDIVTEKETMDTSTGGADPRTDRHQPEPFPITHPFHSDGLTKKDFFNEFVQFYKTATATAAPATVVADATMNGE